MKHSIVIQLSKINRVIRERKLLILIIFRPPLNGP